MLRLCSYGVLYVPAWKTPPFKVILLTWILMSDSSPMIIVPSENIKLSFGGLTSMNKLWPFGT